VAAQRKPWAAALAARAGRTQRSAAVVRQLPPALVSAGSSDLGAPDALSFAALLAHDLGAAIPLAVGPSSRLTQRKLGRRRAAENPAAFAVWLRAGDPQHGNACLRRAPLPGGSAAIS
jgi:hypothetical protein